MKMLDWNAKTHWAIIRNKKKIKNELLQEIGVGPNESVFSKTMGTLRSRSESVNGSGEPIPRGPMDKFVISQPR